jgi:hypothetical protein
MKMEFDPLDGRDYVLDHLVRGDRRPASQAGCPPDHTVGEVVGKWRRVICRVKNCRRKVVSPGFCSLHRDE